MSKVKYQVEGEGALAEHGSRVNITWRLKNFDTQILEDQSTQTGDIFNLDDPTAWHYNFVAHKVGTVIKVKVKVDGIRKIYGAVMSKVIDEEEYKSTKQLSNQLDYTKASDGVLNDNEEDNSDEEMMSPRNESNAVKPSEPEDSKTNVEEKKLPYNAAAEAENKQKTSANSSATKVKEIIIPKSQVTFQPTLLTKNDEPEKTVGFFQGFGVKIANLFKKSEEKTVAEFKGKLEVMLQEFTTSAEEQF